MAQPAPPPVTTVEALQVVPARLPAAESDKAFSIITLDQKNINESRRLDQALAEVPGVVLFRRTDSLVSNPTTQGISLRGIGPTGAGRALVTLDGVPQNDPFGGWVIWAGLPSEIIGGADIVRGGGAGAYGAGALTGVIRLDTRTDMGLEANARVGDLDTQRGGIVDVTTIGGTDVMVGATGGHTGGFIPVRTGRGAADTPTEMNDWSVNLRTTSDFAEGRLAIALGAFNQEQNSGLDKANAEAKGQKASVTWVRNPAGDQRGYRLQAWAMSTNLFNSSVSVPTNRASTTLTNTQYDTPATGYGLNAAIRGDSQDRQWEVGADVRVNHGEDRELFSYTAGNGPLHRYAGGMSQVAGIYAEGTMKRDSLLLTASVRADQWQNTQGHRLQIDKNGVTTLDQTFADRDSILPTARFGARYDNGNDYYRLAAYTGFRAPTLNELYRPFRVGNINTEAN
ncbi:MAG: TonB-dependent receptor plug domain-containing protein, partial [Alphaproteobacteria bacterium]